MPARGARVALIGSDTLIGREIRDLLVTGDFPAQVDLLAAEVSGVVPLTELDGEPVAAARLETETLSTAKLAFLAGSNEATCTALSFGLETPLIDLTYAGEESPRARLRATLAEPAGHSVPANAVHVIAHPAAIVIALILIRLHAEYPLKRTVVQVFEPASERGRAGLDELQAQTVNLLSFKGQPKAVFDAQLCFNMLAGYGEEAPESLEDIELRIERHLATLLSYSDAPMPSLRLIQSPVFHGHSFAFWIEFEENPGVSEMERLLGPDFDVRGGDREPPNIVGMAGEEGIAVGAIRMDRNHPQACWIWAVSDNLRLRASNAVSVARQLL